MMEDLSIMRIFLLLILPLMTGCEDDDVKRCPDGWADFTCKYPRNTPKNKNVDVVKGKKTVIQSTKMNEWENIGRFSVFRDTNKKNLRVIIKELKREDSGEYKCLQSQQARKKGSDEEEEVELKVDKNCQKDVVLTAYRTARTTISCDCRRCNSRVKFFCKDNGSTCEDILKSPQTSNGTFTFTETRRGFNVSISNVSSQHAGFYWCGLEDEDGKNRASLRRIRLEVKAPPNTSPPSVITSTSPHTVTASSVASTQSIDARGGGPWLNVIIPVVVCVVLLVLLLILVLFYKRFRRSNNTINGDQNNEDRAYEEIQERPQKPGSGTALQTIYVTATAPTNSSASPCYSTANFPNAPGEAAGDTYSTVTDSDPCPAYSTVNHPSGLPEDPFYSTANHPSGLPEDPLTVNHPSGLPEDPLTVNHPSGLPEDPFYSTVNNPQQL
ncbi:uncharacterized protein [Cebidichthys violaceus]|uniref:uncharacterized protein n=1 Tax=Cebidichthys violaceus TaxID=271503 RepID=UPI0035CC8D73